MRGVSASSTARTQAALILMGLLLVSLAVESLASQRSTGSQPSLKGPKRTVSVASFAVKTAAVGAPSGLSVGGGFGNTNTSGSAHNWSISVQNASEFGTGLAEVMITSLIESKGFIVLDSDTTGNLPTTNSGFTGAPGQANVNPPVDPSHLPEFIIRATVTELSCRQRSGGISVGGIGGGQRQFENKVTIEVRLVDPLTGEVVESVKATGTKTSRNSLFDATKWTKGTYTNPSTKILDLTYGDFQSTPLAEAARLATEDACKKLIERSAKRPWEARVIKIVDEEEGLEFYLNLNEDSGLQVGDSLELLIQGELIKDPKTGRVTGRLRPKPLGRVKVALVDHERVVCMPLTSIPKTVVQGDTVFIVRQLLSK